MIISEKHIRIFKDNDYFYIFLNIAYNDFGLWFSDKNYQDINNLKTSSYACEDWNVLILL